MRTRDNTMMSDLGYCSRRYALAHARRKRSRNTSSALRFGGLMHIGLDNYYKTLLAGDDHAHMIEASLTSMMESEYEDPIDDYRTRGRALLVMTDYAARYGYDEELTTRMTETPFDITDDVGFPWGGIIDWEGAYHDREWVMDHKTTSRFGNYYFDDYKRDPQMLGYTYAASQIHGQPIAGVIINVLAVRKRDHEFARRPMLYPEWLTDEWRRTMIQRYDQAETIDAIIAADPEAVWDEQLITPNLHNCIGKYGRCAFYDVCDSRPENRERVLRIEYEDFEWNWAEKDD
jgi:hypothetical protein